MIDTAQKRYLCFHGHFYQPPRENPWLDFVEIQQSAFPAHDWNERVCRESYLPMANARIMDDRGLIVRIVNNFERISFNIGPTLFSWIDRHHPELSEAIISADIKSREKMGGHGNAIAQVYNHMIMPLATERDAATQIEWGIRDFESRFGRIPEGMWLAETACHPRTLRQLARAGIRFTILAPSQAEAFRPQGADGWSDVSNGTIDPFQAYTCDVGGGLSINLFFYDGPLSHALSFENLLFESRHLMDRIRSAKVASYENQLIHLSTDGEVYGHHKAFGERALAYVLDEAAAREGFELINYARFLELHPPTSEVRIKPGDDDCGTAWSCAHGVKRWIDDCGCSTGGQAGWHQKWRRPLREAFDFVSGRVATLVDTRTTAVFTDPDRARADYGSLIGFRSRERLDGFLKRHLIDELQSDPPSRVLGLKLLEMQKQAMYMYTSCGWFFSEVSGIEGLQNLKYAARAIELYQEVSGERIEDEFVELLEKAPSNIPQFGNAAGAYRRLVRPMAVRFDRVAAHFGIMQIFDELVEPNPFYSFSIERKDFLRCDHGSLTLAVAHLAVRSEVTLEEREFVVIVFRSGVYEVRCSVKPFTDSLFVSDVKGAIPELVNRGHLMDIVRYLDQQFSYDYFTLRDLFLEEKRKILYSLSSETTQRFSESFISLYDENRMALDMFANADLKIPKEFVVAARYTLDKRFYREIRKALDGNGDMVSHFRAAEQLRSVASEWGITIDTREISEELELAVLELVHANTEQFDRQETERLSLILDQMAHLEVKFDISKAQELFYSRMVLTGRIATIKEASDRRALRSLIRHLGFSDRVSAASERGAELPSGAIPAAG